MKHKQKAVACLLGCLMSSAEARSAVTEAQDNPYNVIVERNVFGLKPPPSNDPTPPPPPPATQVKLLGITTVVSPKRAILQWRDPGQAPVPGKPAAQPGKEQSYIMTEGQREGIIELLEIDEKAGSVKIKNAGEPMTLTFDANGIKLPSTPAPAIPGTLPGAAPGGVPGNPTAAFNPGTPAYNRPVGG